MVPSEPAVFWARSHPTPCDNCHLHVHYSSCINHNMDLSDYIDKEVAEGSQSACVLAPRSLASACKARTNLMLRHLFRHSYSSTSSTYYVNVDSS